MLQKAFFLPLFALITLVSSFYSFSFAADSADFVILPRASESETEEIVDKISTTSGDVWEEINRINYADGGISLEEQLASGAMNRDTIIDMIAYAISKISQLALFIWALMIIRNGYQYAAHAITWDLPNADNIKNAVIWICVVIFSYAIMRALSSAFLV